MYYVYFIQETGKGNKPVKIGYSNDPERRLTDLQTGNPRKLKLSISLPFESESLAREAEQTFQWLAAKKHRSLEGEWFIVYGNWKKFISEVMELFDHNQNKKAA